MKKTILLLTFVSLSFTLSFAKSIDATTAMTIAKNFCSAQATISNHLPTESMNLSLAFKCSAGMSNVQARGTEENVFYIFNVNTADGFVIIAGDDAVTPVLGYADEGTYDEKNSAPAFRAWMGAYKKQITLIKENNIAATDEIKASWNELLTVTGKAQRNSSTESVTPLLTTKWDQYPYYNAYCPGGSVTGCVATTMAQIMKFWNHPQRANGTTAAYTTTTNSYHVPAVILDNYSYSWAAMPISVTSANTQVARLMYNCGVTVRMDYTPSASGAWALAKDWWGNHANSAQSAYTTYFHYNATTLKGVESYKYTASAWISLLKTELNAGRPLQYVAWDTSQTEGHTWVCDGYDINNKLHMNWGWGGYANGYYAVGSLNPSLAYNTDNEALIGIQPVSTVGIDEEENQTLFSFYPNPTHGDFTLKTSAEFRDANVTVINPLGEVIFSDALANSNAGFEKQIHLNAAAGIYYVRVATKDSQYTQKIIVQ